MNAYELADILHQSDFLAMDFAEDAATMLRQQADRIAELEKLVEEMKYEKSSGVYDVSSKPVAWINRFMDDGWLSWDKDTTADVATPLYTHPVKQLSDEEILEIADKHLIQHLVPSETVSFARAIIKEITE